MGKSKIFNVNQYKIRAIKKQVTGANKCSKIL